MILGFLQELAGQVDLVFLDQGFSDWFALGFEEGEGHPAADDEHVNFTYQIADDVDLVADLGAAQDGDKRPLWMLQRFAQVLEFLLHEKPGGGLLHKLGYADGGGVSPMCRAEGIVDVVVGQAGKLFRKLLVIGLFFGMKTKIFQQQGLALFQFSRHLFGFWSNAIGTEADVLAGGQILVQKHAQAFGHRFEAHLGIGLALGAAEMGDQDQSGAVAQGILNGRQSFADASVVHDAAVFERDVEVNAHQDAVIAEREIADGELRHAGILWSSAAVAAAGGAAFAAPARARTPSTWLRAGPRHTRITGLCLPGS